MFAKRIVLVLFALCLLLPYPLSASGEGLTLTSPLTKGDVPNDPFSPVWEKVGGTIVPLSSQIIAQPRAFGTPKGVSSARWVNVRSVNNGKEIAFLLEWEDSTKDPNRVHPGSPTFMDPFNDTATFRDAAAIEFPVTIPKSEEDRPYFGMGHEGAQVNIWQWKADLEEGRDRAVPLGSSYAGESLNQTAKKWYDNGVWVDVPPKDKLRKGPVEDLIAVGFSTISLQDSQDVNGRGVYSGGKWRVVFYRTMTTNDKEDTSFKEGSTIPIAFAIWDGSNDERDGMKSIATWHQLKIEK